jgi:hypothetical protein
MAAVFPSNLIAELVFEITPNDKDHAFESRSDRIIDGVIEHSFP